MKHLNRRIRAGAVWLPVALAGTQPAIAQVTSTDGSMRLEEIIVTAQKREESLQEVAASVVAISGDALTASGAVTGDKFIQQALQGVVGVTVQSENITIRGINSNPNSNATFAPATASYVDGVYSPLGSGGSTVFLATAAGFGVSGGNLDTDRVEVLRGPQGTLFGRSATGGVVNVITKDPIQEFDAGVTVELGSDNLRHYGGMLNVPVSEQFALRVAADSVSRDGYLSNGQNDNKDQQVRLKGLYSSDRFSVMVAGFYQEFGEGYGGGRVPPFTTNPATEYQVNRTPIYNDPSKLWMTYARVEVDLGFATATFIPEYGKQKTTERRRVDFGLDLTDSAPDVNSRYGELRLASKPESKLAWIAGGNYYKLNSITSFRASAGPVPFLLDDNEVKTDSVGAFAQATYPLTDALRLTGGLRYTKEEIDQHRFGGQLQGPMGFVPVDFTYLATFKSTDYKAAAEYDLGEESLLYASVSTGFRPGGISATGGRTFTDEKVTAYEIGSKNLFLDGQWQLNGSVFFYDYPSLQTGIVQFAGPVPFDTNVVTNPAEYKGVELESVFLLTEADKVTLSAGYLDTQFTSLDAVSLAAFKGYQISSAPEWQIAGGYDHRFALPGGAQLNFSADATYRSETYVAQPQLPQLLQPGYTLVDLALKYTSPQGMFDVTGYVRNATDEYYKTGGIVDENTPITSQGLRVGIPRSYGVVLNMHF